MSEEIGQSKWTPADLAAVDPGFWANNLNKIKLPSGQFSFENHEYQKEPMRSIAKRRCCMKATQGGWTEIEVLRTLHGLIYKKYPQGALYMFPTTDNVQEFSKSRFNPLIAANRESIGKFIKPGGRGTDTASLKKVHDAFLYLRGARLSQSVGVGDDEKDSVQVRSIPVDVIVFDELDLMDELVIQKALGRMGHSMVKEEVYLSNPILPDRGIDAVFQKSDQRHLFRKCSCGEWTCAELTFPDCVRSRADSDSAGYIACQKCGKEVTLRKVEWVPAERDNSDYMHGYQWSQLSSIFNDPVQIFDEFQNPPQGNLGDVYRLRLGLPYVAAEDRLSRGRVYECCSNSVMSASHAGPCAMGVDVGKIKHIVIGIKTGRDRYEILKVAQLSKWEDIHDLAKRFNVRSAVIDIRPYEDEARRFQKAESYKTFLCEYTENSATPTLYDDKTGIVRVNRTEIFDSTHRVVAEQQLVIPRKCPQVDTFVAQVCGTAKVLETNKRTGTSIYRYRKLGSAGDHYRNALNYFYLAASGSKIARADGYRKKQKFAINNFVYA